MAMLMDRTKFYQILKDRGLRVTGPRQSLYESLVEHDQPVSINRLITSLANAMDPVTIYRNVELFERIGVINKVYTGWKYRVELSEKFRPHHHHFTCLKCRQIIPLIFDNKLEKAVVNTGSKQGLRVKDHEIELRGLCPTCQ